MYLFVVACVLWCCCRAHAHFSPSTNTLILNPPPVPLHHISGPGAYDLSEHKPRFGNGPGATLKGRHDDGSSVPTPGPNEYNPQLKSRDGITMAGRGTDGDIDDTPGVLAFVCFVCVCVCVCVCCICAVCVCLCPLVFFVQNAFPFSSMVAPQKAPPRIFCQAERARVLP